MYHERAKIVHLPCHAELSMISIASCTSALEQVIRKMATSIQPPDPLRYKWERYSVTIRPSVPQRWSEGVLGCASDSHVQHTSRDDDKSGDEATASAFRAFWRTVAAAAEDPVPPIPALCFNNTEQVGHCGSFDVSCDVKRNTGRKVLRR